MPEEGFLQNPAIMSAGMEGVKRMLIAQRHMWCIDALESYAHNDEKFNGGDVAVLKSRVLALFLELQAGLRRVLSDKEVSVLEAQLNSRTLEELYAAFQTMDNFLDGAGLTEWGTLVPQADDLFAGVDDDLV